MPDAPALGREFDRVGEEVERDPLRRARLGPALARRSLSGFDVSFDSGDVPGLDSWYVPLFIHNRNCDYIAAQLTIRLLP